MSKRKLALIVFFALVVLFLQFRPSHDVDLFWQVKAGQLMLERGSLLGSDPFSSTHAGESVPPIGWMSQVCYAAVHAAGSWRLLQQMNVLVFAGALLLAALTVRERETSTFANLLGMALAVLVALPHCEIRPQSFAILGFALLLWIARLEIRAWWKLLAAGAIIVVWQNMHPSVLLGAAAVGAWAAAAWIRLLRDRRGAAPWLLSVLALMAAAASLATPMGWGIFAVSAYNTQVSRELGITEWLSVWDPATRASGVWIVWMAVAVSVLLAVVLRRRARGEDLVMALVLGCAALLFYRLAMFFAVAMVPVWSRWIAQVWMRSGEGPAKPQAAVGAPRAWCIVAVALSSALIVPRLLHTGVFDRELPLEAAGRLSQFGAGGVVYNYREWGGPLIWEGYPQWKVTIDGRLYVYSPEDWRRYRKIALGEVSVEQVERWYGPHAFFLRPSYHRRFIPLLRQSTRWREVYADDVTIVFVRRE